MTPIELILWALAVALSIVIVGSGVALAVLIASAARKAGDE